MYLRRKWKDRLPIMTVCTNITVGCTPMINDVLRGCWSSFRHRNKSGRRVPHPERFYLEHIAPRINGQPAALSTRDSLHEV